MRTKIVFGLVWSFLCVAGPSLSFAQQSPEKPAYQDAKLPVEQRVKDLVSRMTLEEKVSQLGHTAAAIPRLGVPAYNWWNEGLHGVARAGTATVFPQAIGLAATFDVPLMHDVADVISTEFRAARQTRHLPGPDLLDAQHQYISRSAVGARAGNVWGGSLSDGSDGRCICHRVAGKRSEISEDGGYAETFCGAQRAGVDAAHSRRAGFAARYGRHVFSSVSGRGDTR